MSGKSKSTTTSATSNSFDPWVTNYGKDITESAGNYVGDNSWKPYDGATQGEFGTGFDAANGYLQQLLGDVRPETQMAGSTLQQMLSAMDPTRSVASYMNPYVDSVLQPTIRNINEASDQAGGELARNATMSGAYGDSAHGVQSSLLERNRQRNVGDATAAAYDKAFTSATGARDSELAKILSGSNALAGVGQQAYAQQTGLAQMLAGMGAQEQQANATGVQNQIALNQQNQDAPLKQFTSLAQILAMIPKNTSGTSTSQTTTPDNSGMALLGSLLSSI